jgi:RHS repeat-associated protein
MDSTHEYDAFGRLIRVRNRSTDALVAEYTSNGLGFRTSWKYDANASGVVDGSDPVYWFTHDERWRIVATYRGSDTDPREVFVWHSAGMDAGGGSSYIDSIVLRQDDTIVFSEGAWTAAPDTLNRRVYPMQNWRADVVAVYDLNEGIIAERVRYSAYGVPFCIAAADFNGDGDVDAADNTAYSNANTAGDPSADLNLDNVVDFNDTLLWNNLYTTAETGGRSVLSRSSVRNRIGYAGYQHDPAVTGSAQASGQGKYHVRHRVYDAGVGRWTRRDPLGYVDGMSVYQYVSTTPIVATDPSGTLLRRGSCNIAESTGGSSSTTNPGPGAITCEGDLLQIDLNKDACKEASRLAKLNDKWCKRAQRQLGDCELECRGVFHDGLNGVCCRWPNPGESQADFCRACRSGRPSILKDCHTFDASQNCCEKARVAQLAANARCASTNVPKRIDTIRTQVRLVCRLIRYCYEEFANNGDGTWRPEHCFEVCQWVPVAP